MATVNFEETTLEKLNPPTSIAGLNAEMARVTRTYRAEHTDLIGTRVEIGVPRIEVIWGKAVTDIAADVDVEIARAKARHSKELAALNAEKAAANP